MQFALLVFESPEAFAARNNDETDPYLGAWRAYHQALVEAGIYVGGNPLQAPETGTTVRLKEGKRRVQDGPFADAKEHCNLRRFSGHGRARAETEVGLTVLVHNLLTVENARAIQETQAAGNPVPESG